MNLMRFPLTLWRLLTIDLWRVLLLTAAVVVAVTSFAFGVRFLADGQLGPVLAVRVMFYMVIPMLQYALPFAAGFGATLAYHRFATDNELTASLAGGISHRRALVPALATGVVLALAVLALTDQIMPRLLRATQELVTRDFAQLLTASIARGESVRLGDEGGDNKQIYADSIQPIGPDEPTGAYASMILSGVVALDIDKNGEIKSETSSREAYLWLYRVSGSALSESGADADVITSIVLTPRDVVGRTQGGMIEGDPPTWVYHVQSGIKDDPKYLSWWQLEETKARPETINWIDRERRTLAAILGEREMIVEISKGLTATGTATLRRKVESAASGLAGGTVSIKSAGFGAFDAVKGWALLPVKGGQFVEVTTTIGAGNSATGRRVQRAREAFVTAGTLQAPGASAKAAANQAAGTLTLVMERVSTSAVTEDETADSSRVPAGQIARYQLDRLVPVAAKGENEDQSGSKNDWSARTSAELLEAVKAGAAAKDARVESAAAALSKSIASMVREVVSKQHERLAYAAACVVMVLCGSVLAMRLSAALPLTVYLWSFLPALGCVLTISSGQRLTYQYGAPGLALLWGGVAAMAVFTLIVYRRLGRGA